MRFKNAFKILVTKFSLTWHVLIYYLFITIIIASIGAAVLIPFFETYKAMGLGQEFNKIIITLFQSNSFEEVSVQFKGLYIRIIDEFLAVPRVGWSLRIFLLGIIGVLARLLYGFCELSIVSVLEGHMSANAQYSFSGAYLSNLGKSIKFQFFKMLFTLPYDIFIVFSLYLMTYLFKVPGLALFAPVLIMGVLILLVAFRLTAMSHWGASIIVDNNGVFKGLVQGLKLVFKRKNFLSILSSFIVLVIIAIALNIFITFFTLGAGLFLTVPLTILWCNCINMTSYYMATGKRFYVDSDTIYTSPVSIDKDE
ncbi:MAG TPA: hypothetical protein VIL03_02450 [Clostridia bacterium]|jgi:hypothetical protein